MAGRIVVTEEFMDDDQEVIDWSEVAACLSARLYVKVLCLVDRGSRAWGWATHDSDYDICGVFVYPLKDYLNTPELKRSYSLNGAYMPPLGEIGKKVDFVLWDVRHFIGLCNRSSPSAFELLHSQTVYYGQEFIDGFPMNRELDRRELVKSYLWMRYANAMNLVCDDGEASISRILHLARLSGVISALKIGGSTLLGQQHRDCLVNWMKFLPEAQALEMGVAELLKQSGAKKMNVPVWVENLRVEPVTVPSGGAVCLYDGLAARLIMEYAPKILS